MSANNIDLLQFRQPINYVGNEFNLNYEAPREGELRVCLCFPEVYGVGMSYLGFRIIHDIFSFADNINCERCFMPAEDMAEYLTKNGENLFSIETKTSLKDFDVVAFSINCEVNQINALKMLQLAGIEVDADKRSDSDPLIIGGGLNNPEPIVPAFDHFFMGEFEASADEFVKALVAVKDETKENKLKELTKIPGSYVPSLFKDGDTVERVAVQDFSEVTFPKRWIVPYAGIVFDRIQVEVQRGCPNQCNFCQARCVYFPYRERKIESIVKYLIDAFEQTGYEEASLMGLSVVDYSQIDQLLDELIPYCKKNNISLGIPSIRPIPKAMDIIKRLSYAKKPAMTLAVEAADDHLRRSMGKVIDTDYIKNMIIEGSELNYRNFKFYFMTGLPVEDDLHTERIAEMLKHISWTIKEKKGFHPKLSASVNCFIPKPFSVYENHPLLSRQEYNDRISRLHGRVSCRKNVKIDSSDYDKTLIECVLSRADKSIYEVIKEAASKSLKENIHPLHKTMWFDLFKKHDIDPDLYTQTSQTLPKHIVTQRDKFNEYLIEKNKNR